jgi:hypothetical protein
MKLRKFLMVSVAIFVMIGFLSCDPGGRLLVNGSEKVDINFNNSKIQIVAGYKEGGPYGIAMEYDLENKITIHIGTVKIEYNGKPIENYHFVDNTPKVIRDKDCTLELEGKGVFAIGGIIPESGEKEGDTIRITAPDFITYNGETISLGELILVVGKKVEDKD